MAAPEVLTRPPQARYTCTGGCGEEQLVWAGEPPADQVCPECRRAAELRGRWREDLVAAGVPRGTLARALEVTTGGSSNPGHKRMLQAVSGLDEASPPVALFVGPTGTGKTTSAVCHLANVVQATGRPVAYVPAPRLMLELRQSYGGQRPAGVLERYLRVHWLVLDDLGTEQGTPHELTVLGQLIDERQAEDRPTIVCTNLPLERPRRGGKAIDGALSLQDYDARMVSRLLAGRVVVLDGEDLRLARRPR